MRSDESIDYRDDDIIKARDYVIIKKANQLAVQKLSGKCRCLLWSRKVDLSNAIGKPYWSTFRLELMAGGDEKRPSYRLLYCDNPEAIVRNSVVETDESGLDNRELLDDNLSQNLSRNDITDMKERGQSSRDIIKCLVENSSTFKKKTAYSQEKYLNRKVSRHTEYVQMFKPSLRLLMELYRQQRNRLSKTLTIPFDMLSNVIRSVNVISNGRYILYEEGYQGIILAALLTYIGPQAKVYNVITGDEYDQNAVEVLKFDKQKLEQIINVDCLNELVPSSSAEGDCEHFKAAEPSNITTNSNEEKCSIKRSIDGAVKLSTTATTVDNDKEDVQVVVVVEDNIETVFSANLDNKDVANDDVMVVDGNEETVDEKPLARMLGRFGLATDKTAEELFANDKADGLIVVCKGIPNEIVKTLLNYVKPSRPFVVYSAFQSVLSDLYFELKQHRRNVINVRLRESFLRSYQVLNGRTRPKSTMDGASGFLLTGTVVEL